MTHLSGKMMCIVQEDKRTTYTGTIGAPSEEGGLVAPAPALWSSAHGHRAAVVLPGWHTQH